METEDNKKIPPKAVTHGPKHHFFGYFDKCPWDRSGRYMLALEVDFIDRLPKPEDISVIGLIDLNDNFKFKPVSETRAWNWQQGAKLEWLPPGNENKIIYNDREGDKFISVVLDIKTGEKRKLPMPIYSVRPDGKFAVTLNFSRARGGYDYAGIPDLWQDVLVPDKDGVYLLNLESGEHKLIISTKELYNYNHIGSMEGGKHWVDHLMFNTDGSRFCFLHRWQLSDGGMYMRLFSANTDGTDLYCLLDSGNFSHFGWRNPKELLGWGRLPNKFSRMRRNKWLVKNILKPIRPIYHFLISDKSVIRKKIVDDAYLLFEDQTDIVKKIGARSFDEDGHCSWSPDGNWILTDTYPDKNRYRTLILYDYKNEKRIDIGRFYSLPDRKYVLGNDWDISGMRCDLHPRWNRAGTEVCIDSVHEGTRQMYVLDVENIIKS